MKWNFTFLFVIVAAVVSYGLYQLSYEVQRLERELSNVERHIATNKESIRVLQAEWAFENRPEKIQALAARYLPLTLVAPHQVAGLDEVPGRAVDPFSMPVRAVPTPRSRSGGRKWRSQPTTTVSVHLAKFSKNIKSVRIVK